MTDQERKIGRFMVAIGAIIEHPSTGTILLSKRTDEDHHPDTWEPVYGRIDQFEDLPTALRREVFEETGLENVDILRLLTVWHIFRGEKTAQNEVYGLTFHCQTDSQEVTLSPEHSEYRWVHPAEAIELITVEGIKDDIKFFMENKETPRDTFSGTDRSSLLIVK